MSALINKVLALNAAVKHARTAEEKTVTVDTRTLLAVLRRYTPYPVKAELEKISDLQYINRAGKCPICGYDNIEGDGVDILEDSTARQECWCPHCESRWFDRYNLVGYDMVSIGEPERCE